MYHSLRKRDPCTCEVVGVGVMNIKHKEACSYFNANLCRSCALLDGASRLPEFPDELSSLGADILPWVLAPQVFGLRVKARLSVSGTTQKPILGLVDKDFQGIELLSCPLHRGIINQGLKALPALLVKFKVQPYDIKSRTGELKSVILQTNKSEDSLRIRFVCRTAELEVALGQLAEEFEKKILSVRQSKLNFFASLNVQPIPHQIPEGQEEITLRNEGNLREVYDRLNLFFPAKAFMQVTPEVAAGLYKAVTEIVSRFPNRKVLDLFSGVGAFGLACAAQSKEVLGVELSEDAVLAANYAATFNNLANVTFVQKDLLAINSVVNDYKPDILICNPPRRGLGQLIIDDIISGRPHVLIYSSCNYLSFLSDYNQLKKHYQAITLQPFEMFPLTRHFEVLALCIRNKS